MQHLKEKRAVITGAASGIGYALAMEAIRLGYRVAALDRDTEKLAELSGENPEIFALGLDVSNSLEFKNAGARLQKEFGKPDLWINNAGTTLLSTFEAAAEADFDKVWKVNFLGVVNGTRVALELMKKPEAGTIVNVSSLNGLIAAPYLSAYVASKHAVVGFTRSLREEKHLEHSPLKIALVLPGFVRTPIMETSEDFKFPKWLDWVVEEPENVAKEIFRALRAGKEDILPTVHAKLLHHAQRWAPAWTARSTRALVSKNWKELLGLTPIKK